MVVDLLLSFCSVSSKNPPRLLIFNTALQVPFGERYSPAPLITCRSPASGFVSCAFPANEYPHTQKTKVRKFRPKQRLMFTSLDLNLPYRISLVELIYPSICIVTRTYASPRP